MKETDYTPIDCNYYDVLTVYILHKNEVIVHFKQDLNKNDIEKVQGRIVDVYTKEKAEYLKMDDDSIIRLDKLLRIEIV